MTGDELKWKFNSDGSVNGWGWRLTVYPVMPASGPHNAQSDRSVLSRPSMDLVMWLLDALMASSPDKQIGARLAAALAACAQLSALPASQRMWSLQSLRRLMMTTNYGLSLNIMSESQSSNSVSSPMDSTEVMPATPVILRPLVSDTALAVLVKGLPEMLLRQYEYEDPIVRGGKHLLHSAFFKELVALACHLGLDSLPCCSETYKWAWFRYYYKN